MLHHWVGGLYDKDAQRAWYYVKGGMGSVSNAIAAAARAAGAEILTNKVAYSIAKFLLFNIK